MIKHTINWCKGEIKEGWVFLSVGFLLIILSVIFNYYFIPLIIVGGFAIVLSLALIINNHSRIKKWKKEYQRNPKKFLNFQRKRVEDFMKWYPYTITTASFLVLIGLILILLSQMLRIGTGLIVFGVLLILLDYYSEKRANKYYKKIMEAKNV